MYETEIRPMVWRIDTEKHYAFVMAKTATEAARKAKKLERCGQLSSDFQEITLVKGPWERSKQHVIAGE